MKSACVSELYNMAGWNAAQAEDVASEVLEFEEMLDEDVGLMAWDMEMGLGYDLEIQD
jgi:hypothetical protein